MSRTFKEKKALVIGAVCLGAIAIFSPTVSTYFSQDDWTFLSHVYKKPVANIFYYYPESFYRPVGQQLFFWMNSKIFGLNPIGYHWTALGIHVLNIVLLSCLLVHRGKKASWAKFLLLLSLYAFNPLHFVALNWLTQIDLEIAATFSLGSLLLYKKKQPIAAVLFVFALFSHEITAALPIMIGLLYGFDAWVWFTLGLVGMVGAGKYFINPFPLTSDYSISMTPMALLSTIRWYILRGLTMPEGIKELPSFLRYVSVTLAATIVLTFRLKLVKSFLIFIIALLPVLFLNKHVLAAYGVFALVMMVIVLARNTTEKFSNKYFMVFLSFMMFATSFTIIESMYKEHWSSTRGELSRKMTEIYLFADENEKEIIKRKSVDYEDNSEVYFSTMIGKQFTVLERQ